MPDYLEVWESARGSRLVPLAGERITVGQSGANDLAIPSDSTLSRLHAVLERFRAGWCARDLSSRNGTFVNGKRIHGDCPLRSGDEIRMGSTRLILRTDEVAGAEGATAAAEPAPHLTVRELDVLRALCRPVLSGDLFTEPASTRQIAETLVVTDAAVKQHLLRLYDKFGIWEGHFRRVRLANEAIRRGAVTLADLHASREGGRRSDDPIGSG